MRAWPSRPRRACSACSAPSTEARAVEAQPSAAHRHESPSRLRSGPSGSGSGRAPRGAAPPCPPAAARARGRRRRRGSCAGGRRPGRPTPQGRSCGPARRSNRSSSDVRSAAGVPASPARCRSSRPRRPGRSSGSAMPLQPGDELQVRPCPFEPGRQVAQPPGLGAFGRPCRGGRPGPRARSSRGRWGGRRSGRRGAGPGTWRPWGPGNGVVGRRSGPGVDDGDGVGRRLIRPRRRVVQRLASEAGDEHDARPGDDQDEAERLRGRATPSPPPLAADR